MDRSAAQSLLERLRLAQNAMYAGGEVEPVRSLLTDDVQWSVPGQNAIAGRYRGIDEVLGCPERCRGLAADTLRLRPAELLVGDGDHLAALTDGCATISGAEHHWSTVGLYRIRERRIAACWLLALDQAAFDRAWAAPAGERAPIILGIDHVQVAAPPGCEAQARRFYGRVLGLDEVQKPASLRSRGGAWFALGHQQLHIGVEADFAPARKAHPAIRLAAHELDRLAERLLAAGSPVRWDAALAGARRFYSDDPWGNRLEFVAAERS